MSQISTATNIKPTRECLKEAKQRDFFKKTKYEEYLNQYRNRGIFISNREWERIQIAIKKLAENSSDNCLKISKEKIYNRAFKEFSDRILGEGVGHETS